MADLEAGADIRGQQIDLALAWSDPAAQARSLRLVRRRAGYPTTPSDGLVVLDLADLFVPGTDTPWARIDRQRFLLLDDVAEGGVLQAELALYYAAANDPQPSQVRVRAYDGKADAPLSSVIASVKRLSIVTGSSPSFGSIISITIIAAP